MRCKNCKEKFIPKTFLQKFCMEKPECMERFVKEAKETQWKKRKAEMKAELVTLSDYMKIAQQVFNNYIRERDKYKPCISCGSISGKRDAGHFFSVGNYPSVRLHEDNVHSQCVHCNQFRGGNIHEYRFNIKKKIGEKRFEQLDEEAHRSKKYTIPEIKQLIKHYKIKLNEIRVKQ